MTFHKQLFNRQALNVGWSMFWRMWVAILTLRVVFMLPIALWYSFHRSAAQDPAALRAQYEHILDISGLLVVIALIPALNWIGKSVLRKRNLPVLSRFIGWTIFWRAVSLTLLLSLGAASIIPLPTAFLIRSKPVGAVATLLVVALIFASTIFSYGWATLRVSRIATPN